MRVNKREGFSVLVKVGAPTSLRLQNQCPFPLKVVFCSLEVTSLSQELVGFFFQGISGNTTNLFQVFLSWFVFLGFLFSIDDLTEHWKNLSLSKREGPGLSLKEEQAVTKFILAVKFLTKRALNFEAIANTFQPLWRSRNGFKIENLGNHIALFIFYDKIEIDKILASEPWSFYKHLMVLQCYEDMPIRTMKFNVVNFWVQVHDIPIRFRTKPVVE